MAIRYVARVMGQYLVAQASGVDVQIYFGGGYGFVAEHLLDGAKVGAPFKQMSGEGVAQCVGGYILADSGQLGMALDDVEYHDAG